MSHVHRVGCLRRLRHSQQVADNGDRQRQGVRGDQVGRRAGGLHRVDQPIRQRPSGGSEFLHPTPREGAGDRAAKPGVIRGPMTSAPLARRGTESASVAAARVDDGVADGVEVGGGLFAEGAVAGGQYDRLEEAGGSE